MTKLDKDENIENEIKWIGIIKRFQNIQDSQISRLIW